MLRPQQEIEVGMTTGSTISSKEALLVSDLATLLSCALNASGSSLSQPLKNSAKKLQQLFLDPQLDESNGGGSGVKCFSVPALSLKKAEEGPGFVPRSSKPMLEDAAAQSLRIPLEASRAELSNVPMKLLWNVSKSLMHLIDARLRSTAMALMQQAKSSGNIDGALPVAERLLSTSHNAPITPTTIITTFRTLAFSEMVENNEYIAPLVVEAVVDVNVLGTQETLKIEAPGTVLCAFGVQPHSSSPKIACAEMKVDTAALLRSMMGQARTVVRKAITMAFGIRTGADGGGVAMTHNPRAGICLPHPQNHQLASSSSLHHHHPVVEPNLMLNDASLGTNDPNSYKMSSRCIERSNNMLDQQAVSMQPMGLSGDGNMLMPPPPPMQPCDPHPHQGTTTMMQQLQQQQEEDEEQKRQQQQQRESDGCMQYDNNNNNNMVPHNMNMMMQAAMTEMRRQQHEQQQQQQVEHDVECGQKQQQQLLHQEYQHQQEYQQHLPLQHVDAEHQEQQHQNMHRGTEGRNSSNVARIGGGGSDNSDQPPHHNVQTNHHFGGSEDNQSHGGVQNQQYNHHQQQPPVNGLEILTAALTDLKRGGGDEHYQNDSGEGPEITKRPRISYHDNNNGPMDQQEQQQQQHSVAAASGNLYDCNNGNNNNFHQQQQQQKQDSRGCGEAYHHHSLYQANRHHNGSFSSAGSSGASVHDVGA